MTDTHTCGVFRISRVQHQAICSCGWAGLITTERRAKGQAKAHERTGK